MRHLKKNKKFNRNSSHRLSMFRNMIISLLNYEYIKTTLFKAKILKSIIEPIINLGKINTLFNKRLIFNKLYNKNIILKLFNKLSIKYKNRNGGYISILKIGFRKGDNSIIVLVKLINSKKIIFI